MRYELMQYVTRFSDPQWEHIASADTLREVKAYANTPCISYWVNDTHKGVMARLEVGFTTCRLGPSYSGAVFTSVRKTWIPGRKG